MILDSFGTLLDSMNEKDRNALIQNHKQQHASKAKDFLTNIDVNKDGKISYDELFSFNKKINGLANANEI